MLKTRYFRVYPWGLQLILFLLMIFTMLSFGTFLVYSLLPIFTPYTLKHLESIGGLSPQHLIYTALVVQGILSAFIFLIPSWVFSYLTHPEPGKYLGLRKPGKGTQLLLAVMVMLGAMPILQGLQELVSLIDFGAKVKAAQEVNERMMSAFLKMPDFAAFVRAFIVLAIIPAVGEELFFRGVLLRFANKRSRRLFFPIVFTSMAFAYTHANIYGFLSIMLAGALLAVIYYLTGSLWCSILAHMSFNGSQIIASYLNNGSAAINAPAAIETTPWYYIVGGAVVFGISLYLLLKTKTPLPENWTDDFPPDAPKGGELDLLQKN